MLCAGVSWYLPPKGISTVFAPMVESNRSARPRFEHTFRSCARLNSFSSFVLPGTSRVIGCAAQTCTRVCFSAPLEFKNSREMSTIFLPFHSIVNRGSATTSATTVASRFSSAASVRKRSASAFPSTTAMRSCDSEMASSVPSRPSYFFGTLLRSMCSPSANSPMATETPPAPKSLQRLMSFAASGLRNSLCSLRSSGALPFCTSAPQCSKEERLCDLEEPVAPPQPSRPVRPPKRTTTSPGCGTSRRTFLAGTAPTTAPISIRLAT